MKRTHTGSCHCGKVRFECELDLSAGTMRCNCGMCQKARLWVAMVKATDLRLLQGADALSDYQYTPAGRSEPFLHFNFCKYCGVRPFTKGGALPQWEGEFYAVNIACLDDVSDAELAATPIHFADGRHDRWDATSAEHRHL